MTEGRRDAVDSSVLGPFPLVVNGFDDNVDNVLDGSVRQKMVPAAWNKGALSAVVNEKVICADVLGLLTRTSKIVHEHANLEEGILEDLVLLVDVFEVLADNVLAGKPRQMVIPGTIQFLHWSDM